MFVCMKAVVVSVWVISVMFTEVSVMTNVKCMTMLLLNLVQLQHSYLVYVH